MTRTTDTKVKRSPSDQSTTKIPASRAKRMLRRKRASRVRQLQDLQKLAVVQVPDANVPIPAPSQLYRTLFRLLLLAACALSVLGLVQSQTEQEPTEPQISTTKNAIRTENETDTSSGSVDDPPPDILVQPSN